MNTNLHEKYLKIRVFSCSFAANLRNRRACGFSIPGKGALAVLARS